MEIRDIVNQEVANLSSCESEPIHIPGSIQPHGVFFVVEPGELAVTYCSANSEEFLGVSPAQMLSMKLADIFGEQQVKAFREYLAGYESQLSQPFVLEKSGVEFNTVVSLLEGQIHLELEPFPDGRISSSALYIQTTNFVSILQQHISLQDLCQYIAEETRRITGYDRVMIYRFDEDYNGEVFAEARKEEILPFLGHHYPHSDIPAQARELYLRNLLRIIVDVNYTPVPILTLQENSANHSVDMSSSVLRSVSPIHIQYLKNMGVGATLNISLIRDGKLWGLIACHHYSPHNIPYYTRLSALLQGHFLTSQIAVREQAEDYECTIELERKFARIQEEMSNGEHILTNFREYAIADLINASGVLMMHDGQVFHQGSEADKAALLRIGSFIRQNIKEEAWHTSALSRHMPEAAAFAEKISGVVYRSLGNSQDYILWYRPQVIGTIEWAGNPSLAVQKDNSTGRLSPRTSFELWKEEVDQKTVAWRQPELQIATTFSHTLNRYLNLLYIQRYNAQLKNANQELENLNWIGTHDLKEPLRKIQLFGSRLMMERDQLTQDQADSIEKMHRAAERMFSLVNDLLSFSRLRHEDKTLLEDCDLSLIVNSVISDYAHEIQLAHASITVEDLPSVKGVSLQLYSLFYNLVVNAIKFRKEGVNPVVRIECQIIDRDDSQFSSELTHERYYMIDICDEGIGFESQYNEQIFLVFKRLHGVAEYSGTGIGLAICRKIMEQHQGIIKAEGTKDKGAKFSLYFPVTQ